MSTSFPGSSPAGGAGQNCTNCGKNIPASQTGSAAPQCPDCGHWQPVSPTFAMPPHDAAGKEQAASTGSSSAVSSSVDSSDPASQSYVAQPPGEAAAAINQPADPQIESANEDTPSGIATAASTSSEPATPAAPATAEDATQDSVAGRVRDLFDAVRAEISKVFIGQDELVLGTLVALFSSGHVLIESVPGLGKTLFVRTLGKVLGCEFGRIQFTADLMPSDISGAPVFDMKEQEFRFRPGPVFTQFLLADEINRAPAKTHAALLEIMQEYRVTVDGVSHLLTRPFLVLATQNPVESEGTYNLPEAQLDRFMFKLHADYPDEAEEARILEMHSLQVPVDSMLENLKTVASPEQILEVTSDIASVRIDPRLVEYINKLVRLTREWPQFHMGASPRAGIALMQAARTLACFSGRNYAVPDDVVEIVLPALRHRVILTAEAEVEGYQVDDILRDMIRTVEVPRL